MKPDEVIKTTASLLRSKAHDYSNDNLAQVGVEGLASRLLDKVTRARTLIASNGNAKHESLRDTFTDMIGYAAIGASMIDGDYPRTTKLVYLAGPIDAATDTETHGWRNQVSYMLRKRGVASYDPSTAHSMPNPSAMAQVSTINREAIRQSDVVLAHYPPDVVSFGTVREIEFARYSCKKRVILVAPWLQNYETYDLERAASLQDAVQLVWADLSDE